MGKYDAAMMILLTGNDSYTLSQKLKELREKFVKEVDASNLNSVRVEGKTLAPGMLRTMLAASPFLAKRRMVVLDHCGESIAASKELSKEWSDLLELIGSAESDSPIVVIVETIVGEKTRKTKKTATQKPDGRKKFLEVLPKNAIRLEAWLNTQEEAVALARSIARRHGATLDRSAVALAARLPLDSWLIANLMETISAFHADAANPITAQEMEQFVSTTADDVLFNLQDALGIKQGRLLLVELSTKLNGGVRPLSIMGAMGKTAILLEAALRGQLPPGTHPFVAKKINEQSRHWNSGEIRRLLTAIVHADALMKTSSNLDGETLLERIALAV